MDFYSSIDKALDNLKKNPYGIIIKKTQKNMLITTSIKFPKEILNREISEMSIEFLLIIDLFKPKFFPKLYCISPYCYPHFADGRDIFQELPSAKNPKKSFNFSNILSEILEFIKANFQKGGLYFFGKHYLGGRYDLRMLKKGCDNKNIFYVKENLILNGKSTKLNRLLILSDVYFLMFEQEKWYKNNLMLIFWSSISNIQKVQKVKESKTLILQWSQKEKETFLMSLTINQRDDFIDILLKKMHEFGMAYDVKKIEENKEQKENDVNKNKKKLKQLESQNQKLIDIYQDQENDEDYNNEEEEEEEEDDDNEEDKEENKEDNKEEDKNINENNEEKKSNGQEINGNEDNNNDINKNINNEKNEENKENIEENEEHNKEEINEEVKNEEINEEIKNEETKEEKELEKIEEKKMEIEDKEEDKKEENIVNGKENNV